MIARMSELAGDRGSLRRLRRHAEALRKFRETYERYLAASRGQGNFTQQQTTNLRRSISSLTPAASAALEVAGMEPGQLPPPALGGYAVSGLPNLVFLHERSFTASDVPGFLLDMCDSAIAKIEDMLSEEKRRRWNPLYWVDRFLRAVLGIPAYLISITFRVPLRRIEESVWGTALRLLTLFVEVGLLVFGAHEWFGWF